MDSWQRHWLVHNSSSLVIQVYARTFNASNGEVVMNRCSVTLTKHVRSKHLSHLHSAPLTVISLGIWTRHLLFPYRQCQQQQQQQQQALHINLYLRCPCSSQVIIMKSLKQTTTRKDSIRHCTWYLLHLLCFINHFRQFHHHTHHNLSYFYPHSLFLLLITILYRRRLLLLLLLHRQ